MVEVLGLHHIFYEDYFSQISNCGDSIRKIVSNPYLLTDPIEIKHRQAIVREMTENHVLFETFCDMQSAVADLKQFLAYPSVVFEDIFSNLRYLNNINETVNLLKKLLLVFKANQYKAQWLKEIFLQINRLIVTVEAGVFNLAEAKNLCETEFLRCFDFGLNFDDTMGITQVKLLDFNAKEYINKDTQYKLQEVKPSLIDRVFANIRSAGQMTGAVGQSSTLISFTGETAPNLKGNLLKVMSDEEIKNLERDQFGGIFHVKPQNDQMNNDDYHMKIKSFENMLKTCCSDVPGCVRNFISLVENELGHILSPYEDAICAAKIANYWKSIRIPFCFPEIDCFGKFTAENLYNPYLAETMKVEDVVSNNVSLQEEIALVTGANQGGKTSFAVAVTLAQFLFQIGFPIPAVSAHIGIAESIAAVFDASESGKIGTGRLGEELENIAYAFKMAKQNNCFFCFNEPLTGTSTVDLTEIMGEVITSLAKFKAIGIWVTHLLSVAAESEKMNSCSEGSKVKNLQALVTKQENGIKKLYKIAKSQSAACSYAHETILEYIQQEENDAVI